MVVILDSLAITVLVLQEGHSMIALSGSIMVKVVAVVWYIQPCTIAPFPTMKHRVVEVVRIMRDLRVACSPTTVVQLLVEVSLLAFWSTVR